MRSSASHQHKKKHAPSCAGYRRETAQWLVHFRRTYYQPLPNGYDNAPMWQVEPRNIPIATGSRAPIAGLAAPPTGNGGQCRQIRGRLTCC